MIEFIKNKFKAKYTPYKYVEDVIKKEEIMADRYDDLMANDVIDLACIPTGKFKEIVYEKWVRYNTKTKLPQYKLIKK